MEVSFVALSLYVLFLSFVADMVIIPAEATVETNLLLYLYSFVKLKYSLTNANKYFTQILNRQRKKSICIL